MKRALLAACLWSASLQAATQPKAGLLTDITARVGLDFVHDPGDAGAGRYLLPEIMGPGAAFFDYDGDGDLDIYLVQAGRPADSASAPPTESTKPNRLFRQRDDGTFEDATTASGLGDRGYGMGVAVGDIDNDGRLDVYVTNYGPDALYRNRGEGRFENDTARASIRGSAWSASAVFCDYDRDGFLDLYVTHYVSYDVEEVCTQADGSRDYCAPAVFPGTADTLYHNTGQGSFEDVSSPAGIDSVRARGLGVVCADFDDDGFLDFYVANDGEANQLWKNQGDGTFVDEAFLAGVALNAMGRPQAGMGVAAGDVDGDLDLDLFLTHIADETNTLYSREGELGFDDRTTASGLAGASLGLTGFGTGFLDLDHDGDLDLVIANGRVERKRVASASSLEGWARYAEPNQIMLNEGGRFVEMDRAEGGDFLEPVEISRGLALGDVDGDGDVDLLVANTAGPARLYSNDLIGQEGSSPRDWILVRAFDPGRRRDAHGALITVVTASGRYQRIADPGFGYLSSSDPRAHFGLPRGVKVERFEVVWPDATRERFPGTSTNREVVLEKGRGEE